MAPVPRGATAHAERSGSTCPACGKGLDPLRAGHVAVLGGAFFYFCDRSCKADYMEARPIPDPEAVDTAAAPPVALLEAALSSGLRPRAPEPTTGASPAAVPPEAPAASPPSALAFPEIEASPSREPVTQASPPPPLTSTLRSAARAPRTDRPSAPVVVPAPPRVPTELVPMARAAGAALPSTRPPASSATTAPVSPSRGPIHLLPWLPSMGALGCGAVAFRGGDPAGASLVSAAVLGLAFTLAGQVGLRAVLRRAGLEVEGRQRTGEPSRGSVPHGVALAMVGALAAGVVLGLVARASLVVALGSAFVVAGGLGAAVALGAAHLYVARIRREAAESGIVYRDEMVFQQAGRVDRAVLCTRGAVRGDAPEVVATEAVGTLTSNEVLAAAAGALGVARHPHGPTLARAAAVLGVLPAEIRSADGNVEGVTAVRATGEPVLVGGRSCLLDAHVSMALAEARAAQLEEEGRLVLFVAVGGRVAGLVALHDPLLPGARGAIRRLVDANIEPILMGSEARVTGEALARALDVEHVRPEVPALEMAREVRLLADGDHTLAVLARPGSDDGALTAAGVGVALQPAGTALVPEWPIVIRGGDVRDGARALTLAQAAHRGAQGALALAAIPGVLVGLVAALGVVPLPVAPLVAAAAGGVALFSAARRPLP